MFAICTCFVCDRCRFISCSSVWIGLMFCGIVVSVKVISFLMYVSRPPPLL